MNLERPAYPVPRHGIIRGSYRPGALSHPDYEPRPDPKNKPIRGRLVAGLAARAALGLPLFGDD